MTRSIFLGLLSLIGIVLVSAAAYGARALMVDPEPKAVIVLFASMAPYLCAVALVFVAERKLDAATLRRATWIILIGAALMRLLLIACPPNSTDIFRYVWDGRVQAAGINPYRYVPADPALRTLRDAAIYPNINRAGYAPTIYPPGAQMLFLLVGLVGGGVTAMKALVVLVEAAGIAALMALLRRKHLAPTRVALYAWHPLALYEGAGSGHIDVVAIALTLVALLAADRGRTAGAGLLLGLATMTKFFPVVIAPALWRRGDWRAPVATLATIVACYLPYLRVGKAVLGFLGGYAHEEAIDAGTGFFLLGWIDQQTNLPTWARPAYLATALAVLAGIALLTILRRQPERAAMGWALALLTAFTAFMSPHLPWYFIWTIPFLCFTPSPAAIWLSCSAGVLYWQAHDPDDLTYSLLIYAPFLLLLIGELAVRGSFKLREYHHVSFA